MNNLKNRSIRNEQIANMVFASILAAIILIMTFVPQFGLIQILPPPAPVITIIHIPVIIGGIVLGRKYGLFLGFIFGIGALIRSFIDYANYAPFTNPLVSVLPRMFIGFIASDIHKLFARWLKNDKGSSFVSMGIVTFIHSIIVLPLLFIVWKTSFFFFRNEFTFGLNQNLFAFIWASFLANSIFEIALAILIGGPIIIVLKVIKNIKR